MCGIFGRVNLPGAGPVSFGLCRRQTDTLRHRGPDAGGYLLACSASGAVCLRRDGDGLPEPPAGPWDLFLGHRRLAVLDLSEAAAQPMAAQGRYWISFNGEIYNYQELRRQLAAEGVTFRTANSDTEVLLWAFVRWGEECLRHLRGMFAFAILDLKARRLFLARDRLGKKPLYYYASPAGFQFASELKALLADPEVPRELDPVALSQYLLYGYIPSPRTIFRGLAKLPPAHLAWVELDRPGELRLRRYWQPVAAGPEGSWKDWQEEFEAELTAAVRLRLVSDVPLGAFSSGGLDSTLVVRQMHRLGAGPLRTFAIGFPEAEASELPWARQVATRYRTEHTEEVVSPDALALLPEVVRQFDEPFADSSALPTLIVSRLARRQVTVALSGDGGDEILAGYRRYHHAARLEHLWGPVPEGLRRPLFGLLALAWPARMRGKSFWQRAAAGGHLYRAIVSRDQALGLVRPELRPAPGDQDLLHAHFTAAWEEGPRDFLTRLQYVDLLTYLPEDILVKADRASMAASLELRCPLLDHRLVELALGLPQALKYDGRRQKVLLRHLLAADLGPGFVERPKNGFQMPLRRWLKGDVAAILTARLLPKEAPLYRLCQPEAVAALLRRFLGGQQDLSEDLWRLLVLDEWCRQSLGG
ncbi:MAG: asparagine synthase (glutamine-hydrolyzing) [Syntrophobacterales bacterium]|nr:asparagine synthase (glutamine-hydrolyzing) [Syntrophobacterales bacterium]